VQGDFANLDSLCYETDHRHCGLEYFVCPDAFYDHYHFNGNMLTVTVTHKKIPFDCLRPDLHNQKAK